MERHGFAKLMTPKIIADKCKTLTSDINKRPEDWAEGKLYVYSWAYSCTNVIFNKLVRTFRLQKLADTPVCIDVVLDQTAYINIVYSLPRRPDGRPRYREGRLRRVDGLH